MLAARYIISFMEQRYDSMQDFLGINQKAVRRVLWRTIRIIVRHAAERQRTSAAAARSIRCVHRRNIRIC